MKRFNVYMILIAFVISTILLTDKMTIEAKSIKEYEEEINKLEDKKSSIDDKRNKVSENKQTLKDNKDSNLSKQDAVETEMEEIDGKLTHTKRNIDEKETAIDKINTEIKQLNKEITALEEEIDILIEKIAEREALLNDRLRTIQATGGEAKLIKLIFEADSFTELMSRSSAVNTIMDQDKEIMEAQARDKLALENKQREIEMKKSKVETKKENLQEEKSELQSLKSTLDKQLSKQEKIKAKLVKEFEELEDYELTLDEQQSLMDAEAAVIEEAKALASSKKQTLVEEEQARIAAAKAQAEAEAERAKQMSKSSTSSANTASSEEKSASPVISSGGSGKFTWPAKGRITSPFGARTHPVTGQAGKMHHGLDIAGPAGSPIYAADDGVVSVASGHATYGNHIMVTHGSVSTLYAHLSSMDVSPGQKVEKGQVIGKMGATGRVTGVHLHFEVYPGKYNYGSAVNPLSYLP